MSLTRKRNKTFSFKLNELQNIRLAILKSIKKVREELIAWESGPLRTFFEERQAHLAKNTELARKMQQVAYEASTAYNALNTNCRSFANPNYQSNLAESARRYQTLCLKKDEIYREQIALQQKWDAEHEGIKHVPEQRLEHLKSLLAKHESSLKLIEDELLFYNLYLIEANVNASEADPNDETRI